jgi:hypothetical protein
VLVRSTRDAFVSVIFVLAIGACGNFGGCGACGSSAPLPPNVAGEVQGLPANQTVEGGAQIRVTKSGFDKLTSILPGSLNSQLANGVCVPQGSIGGFGTFGVGARWCDTNNGGCSPGCKAHVSLNQNGFSLSVNSNTQTLNIAVSTTLSTTIHIYGQATGALTGSCNLNVNTNNLNGNIDVAFGTDAATGQLTVQLASINSFQLNMDFSGCGILSTIANTITNIFDVIDSSFLGTIVNQLLTPVVNNLIQGFLPNPLGIAGMIDVGKLLASVSSGTKGEVEARIVPGGYVDLVGNGMSLGVIMGINSDSDPTTRSGTRPDGIPYWSEPARCVPAMLPPDFSGAPWSLPRSSRSTFALSAADEFNGMPDPSNADIAMGISQTSLDQIGHHLVTSGGMCLGVGTTFIHQLNVGTIGILVPSLGDLADPSGNSPLLLVTRPQRPLTFAIGDNNPQSPALTIGIDHMEVDFYAFLYERYVRAFTLVLTLNVGVNLEFDQQPGMPAVIKPSLTGIDANSVQLSVINSEFVKESAAHLEMVLPSVFSLITPLLGNLPTIQVPTFAGFSLNNLSVQRVMTSQDEFLALYAQLGSGLMLRSLAQHEPLAQQALETIDGGFAPAAPASTGTARFVRVDTPTPESIVAALKHEPLGKLPSITFDVDPYDTLGRKLEWSWSFDDGMQRPFTSASPLVITDRAFAWQGKYTIVLKSRVVGDYTTTSAPIRFPVVIDSVGPKIFTDKATWDGNRYHVPVFDVVSENNVKVAFGRPGDTQPSTDWLSNDAAMARGELEDLAAGGNVQVFAVDETGNRSIALIQPFHGQPGTSGCACDSSGAPPYGAFVLVAIVGFAAFGRRGRVRRLISAGARSRVVSAGALWLGASAVLSLQPGCSCHKNPAGFCETVKDCGMCPNGQLPFCIDNMCVCSDDIPPGRIGPYSKVAVSTNGQIYVSAYAESHGDLVVAEASGGRIPVTDWEWVDGVPDEPPQVPGSKIRGGIGDDGTDVGMYTSIQVNAGGTPMVAYFDRTNTSLKFATRNATGTSPVCIASQQCAWTTHTVDAGDTNHLVGMYTSLTLRADDGRPGIAYLAHVTDAMGEHAEVRFAQASTATPASASDWKSYVVDTAPVPAVDPNHPNVYPLPEGLGLFISATRDPRDQSPVIVYYDRTAGELKVSRYNAGSDQFGTAVVLDGGSGIDDGWNPSVAVDAQGVVHAAYVDATSDQLLYIVEGQKAEVIDDGYRVVGMSIDGYPKPEFHQVADAGLVMPSGVGPMVVYQDATTQELLLAQRQMNGMWTHVSVAGATDPWPGAYGFFASIALEPNNAVLSTWVIDQPTEDNWVEVFTKQLLIQ